MRKLDARARLARDRRKEALKFYADRRSLPSPAGPVAHKIHLDLLAIHRSPLFNGAEKEQMFKAYLNLAHKERP